MTPRSTEQFQQMREDSRDRILAAAVKLFARHGYGSTSVRMIANEAGVAQGLLYNYFDGKEGLLRAVFERGRADVAESLSASAAERTAHGEVERLVRSALEIVDRHREFWRLSYQLRFQPDVVERMGKDMVDWSKGILQRIEGMLRRGGADHPETQARVLFAAIDGAAQHYVLDPEGYPADEVCRELVARFTASSSRNENEVENEGT